MGFKIELRTRENGEGEIIWESEEEHYTVDRVSTSTSRGEAGSVQIDNSMDRLILIVNVRDTYESTYGDVQELERLKDREENIMKHQKENPLPKPAPSTVAVRENDGSVTPATAEVEKTPEEKAAEKEEKAAAAKEAKATAKAEKAEEGASLDV